MILEKHLADPRGTRYELDEIGGRNKVPPRRLDKGADLVGRLPCDLFVALEDGAAQLVGGKPHDEARGEGNRQQHEEARREGEPDRHAAEEWDAGPDEGAGRRGADVHGLSGPPTPSRAAAP